MKFNEMTTTTIIKAKEIAKIAIDYSNDSDYRLTNVAPNTIIFVSEYLNDVVVITRA
ncbi:MAG: hypothetical protein MJZ34_15480 [Paludibacteraceae bacterium]|nr:hypothetical protein [Paludibacteraceae bacterium]